MGRQIVAAVGMLAAVALVAFLGSLASASHTDGWYTTVDKVPWNPPNSVFGPAWSILYLFIAAAGWLIWRSGYRAGSANPAKPTLALFAGQLVVNGLWTPAFFALYPVIGELAWWIALVVIIVLIAMVAWCAVASREWSKTASWLMVPYLAWLVFATTLNIGIIALN